MTEPRFDAIVHVRIPAGARTGGLCELPPPGHTSRDRLGSLVASVAPNDYLVFAPAGSAAGAPVEWSIAASGSGGTVVDVTHARAVLRLSGPAAADVLARVCAIDLQRKPAGCAVRTSLARIVTDIVHQLGDEPSYLLHADRSYGRYLLSVLLDAGLDDGIEVVLGSSKI